MTLHAAALPRRAPSAPPAPVSAPPAFEARGPGRRPGEPRSAGHRAPPGPSPGYRWEVPPARTPARLDVAEPAAGRPRVAHHVREAESPARLCRTPRTARTTRTAEETHP